MIRPKGGQPPASLLPALGLAALRAYFVCFSYYYVVMLFLNMVCLNVVLAVVIFTVNVVTFKNPTLSQDLGDDVVKFVHFCSPLKWANLSAVSLIFQFRVGFTEIDKLTVNISPPFDRFYFR
jgi:hypothetical protein